MGKWRILVIAAMGIIGGTNGSAQPPESHGLSLLQPVESGSWHFEAEMGRRIDANVDHWILRAPVANPGMLDMFRSRDRALPYPQVVDFAGEFAGKYLISAVQALDLTDDPRLEPFVAEFVNQLINTQAEDGYLGPFSESERLRGHWDLWGHYHCMWGLLMWYDRTGDERALACVLKAADLMCGIYVGADYHPVQAGAPETNNLAVIHVLANLYRRTGKPEYLQLIRVIEEDMTTVGDWLREGAAGTPFYLLNGQGNRWESLHIVQGLAEMYRLTGEARYKDAVLNTWDCCRRYDRHPSGAFSTYERGAGSIYSPGQIETCCSIAWMALTVDVLELTGDARAADELELTTWNQVLAAQHPSGRWNTYDTPINGVRYPAFHQIGSQGRPSTPELNCCSTNGPRGLGILRAWALMEDASSKEGEQTHPGLTVNFYGPGTSTIQRANGNTFVLAQETRYPLDGEVKLIVSPDKEEAFALRPRIPAWSRHSEVRVNGEEWATPPVPGEYLAIERTWKQGDTVELGFDMTPRFWTGAGIRVGRAAVHRGPLLLAYDAYYNDIEAADLPPIDPATFKLEAMPVADGQWPDACAPMGLWKATTATGAEIVLTSFASAGAHGTEYAAWLPVEHAAPPLAQMEVPRNGASMGPGTVVFEWAYYGAPHGYHYELTVAKDPDMQQVVLEEKLAAQTFFADRGHFTEEGTYYWIVRTVNEFGTTTDPVGPWDFVIDNAASPCSRYIAPEPDGPLAASPLDGTGEATASLGATMGGSVRPTEDRHGEPGKALESWWFWSDATMRFKIPEFPADAYTLSLWLNPSEGGYVHSAPELYVVSAWCGQQDDPLRIINTAAGLLAEVETSGGHYRMAPTPVEKGTWTHVAVVKDGTTLSLYLDGEARQSIEVPETLATKSTAIGLWSNPSLPPYDIRLPSRMDDFAFYPRALTQDEISALASE